MMQLFIANNCHDCDKVEKYIRSNHSSIKILNVDTMEFEWDYYLHVFPALCDEKSILAYGKDIIDYLEKK